MVNSAAAPIAAYCTSSILMTLTNKLVLSSFNFKMNFLFLTIQSLGCVMLLEIFTVFGFTQHKAMNRQDAKVWFKVTLALVAMIYTGSKALQFLSVPVFTIFKNLTIILIAYLERVLLKGSPITNMIFTAFSMMVLSSMVAGYADLAAAQFSPIGYFWMTLNCLSTAGFTLMLKATIKQVGFKDFDTVYYNSKNGINVDLISIPILLTMSFLTEGGEFSNTVNKYFGEQDNSQEFHRLLFGILVSSVCTFGISFSTSWCVRITGATTYR